MEEKATMEPTQIKPEKKIQNNQTVKSSKLPLLIIVLLLILLVPLGGYFLLNGASSVKTLPSPTPFPTQTVSPTIQPISPTPTAKVNETSDWKSYTNFEFNYSLKYPGKTYIRLICPGEQLDLRTRTAEDTTDQISMPNCGRGGYFEIEVSGKTVTFTEPATDENINVTKTNTTVAGTPAREYISTIKPGAQGPVPDYSNDIYFDRDGMHYLIHFGKNVSPDTKTNMIASFQFTK